MKIQSSSMNLYSRSMDKEKITQKKTFVKQQGDKPTVNQQFREQLKQLKSQARKANQVEETDNTWQLSEEDYQKITLLERILSELTGKDIKFNVPGRGQMDESKYDQHVHQALSKGPFRIFKEEVSYEKESSLEFGASGSITTEDGRSIKFDFNIQESRHIKYERSTTTIEGQLIDPLAFSFDGKLPKLTDEKYSFDLDFDGREDQISFLTKGSGFLAFDKNEDGKINDGSELFGTQSGSGFKDLAVFDQDNNGWIDENDDIFNGLRIWTKDDDGKDQLIALGEKGIGAIFLGSVASRFDILASNFEQSGVIRESGVYLNEDGSAGNIHHVDIQL